MSLFRTSLTSLAPKPDVAPVRKRKHAPDEAPDLTQPANINIEKLLAKFRASVEKDAQAARKVRKGVESDATLPNGNRAHGEHRDKTHHKKRQERTAPVVRGGNSDQAPLQSSHPHGDPFDTRAIDQLPKHKKKKKRTEKKDNGADAHGPPAHVDPSPRSAAHSLPHRTAPTTAPSAQPSMRDEMRKKLGGSRFRFINEQLYTMPGDEAQQLMEDDPGLFDEYHVGFRAQADRWPSHPLHIITKQLQTLPERSLVADLGCGEAALAKALKPRGIRVLSFDLVGDHDWVVKAQCSRLVPLPSSTVDVAVCCLSLMGSDWIGMIREARRLLTDSGRLKIAEVTSRFQDVKEFISLVERTGFRLESQDARNTHFLLFDFVKSESHANEKDDHVAAGLLKPCVYKKR